MEIFLTETSVLVMPILGVSALVLLRFVYKKALPKPQ